MGEVFKIWKTQSGRGYPPGTKVKARWAICSICQGYGREIHYIGEPSCSFCDGTGKRFEIRAKSSLKTKEDFVEWQRLSSEKTDDE